MQHFALVTAGTVVELRSLADGLAIGDYYPAGMPWHACDDTVQVGWTWSEGGGFAAPVAPTPTMDDLVAYAAALRGTHEAGGMTVDEWRVGTGERDTVRAMLARRRADDDPAAMVAWLDADGVPWELQAADIVAITDRIVRRAHDLNAAHAAARDAIAAGDVRGLADVELFFGDFDTLGATSPAAPPPPAPPPPGN